MQPIDRTGKRYGRLVALQRAQNTSAGKARWVCRCDCGRTVTVISQSLDGHTTSCGCLRSDKMRAEKTTHGASDTPEYEVWATMKQRCHNPNNERYADYGGRGIRVCREWELSFLVFIRDMGPRPSPLHTIERIDNSRGYEPGNCRWATHAEQSRNRRVNISVGAHATLVDLATEYGVVYSTLYQAVRRGEDPQSAAARLARQRHR